MSEPINAAELISSASMPTGLNYAKEINDRERHVSLMTIAKRRLSARFALAADRLKVSVKRSPGVFQPSQ